MERQSDGAAYVGNRRFDHELYSQHRAQLLLAAGEHGLIPPQICQSILVIDNDLGRGLGGKFLIAEFSLQPLDLFRLFGLFFENTIQRFIEIDVASHQDADGQAVYDEPKKIAGGPGRRRSDADRATTEVRKVVS